jgi:molybdenum-dependent DNA-binding transcriptional regulator ModE
MQHSPLAPTPGAKDKMDRLQTMRVFQAVADEAGFSAAARRLDMSVPTVTRLVADLEQHLGTRLLQRTTRSVSLTEAGEAYLERVRGRACATKDEAVRLTTLKDCRCIFGVLVVWMRGT